MTQPDDIAHLARSAEAINADLVVLLDPFGRAEETAVFAAPTLSLVPGVLLALFAMRDNATTVVRVSDVVAMPTQRLLELQHNSAVSVALRNMLGVCLAALPNYVDTLPAEEQVDTLDPHFGFVKGYLARALAGAAHTHGEIYLVETEEGPRLATGRTDTGFVRLRGAAAAS